MVIQTLFPLGVSSVIISLYYFYYFFLEKKTSNIINVDPVLYEEYDTYSTFELGQWLLDYSNGITDLQAAHFETIAFIYLNRLDKLVSPTGFGLLGYLLFSENNQSVLFIKKILIQYFLNKPADFVKEKIFALFYFLDKVYRPKIEKNSILQGFLETIYFCFYQKNPSNIVLNNMLTTVLKEKTFSSLKQYFIITPEKTLENKWATTFLVGVIIVLGVFAVLTFPSHSATSLNRGAMLGGRPSMSQTTRVAPPRGAVATKAFRTGKNPILQVYFFDNNKFLGAFEKTNKPNEENNSNLLKKMNIPGNINMEALFEIFQQNENIRNPFASSIVFLEKKGDSINVYSGADLVNQKQKDTQDTYYTNIKKSLKDFLIENKTLLPEAFQLKDNFSINELSVNTSQHERAHIYPAKVGHFSLLRSDEVSNNLSSTIFMDKKLHTVIDQTSRWDITDEMLKSLDFESLLIGKKKEVINAVLSYNGDFKMGAPSSRVRQFHLALIAARYDYLSNQEITTVKNTYNFLNSNHLIDFYFSDRALTALQDTANNLKATMQSYNSTLDTITSSLSPETANLEAINEALLKKTALMKTFRSQEQHLSKCFDYIQRSTIVFEQYKDRLSSNPNDKFLKYQIQSYKRKAVHYIESLWGEIYLLSNQFIAKSNQQDHELVARIQALKNLVEKNKEHDPTFQSLKQNEVLTNKLLEGWAQIEPLEVLVKNSLQQDKDFKKAIDEYEDVLETQIAQSNQKPDTADNEIAYTFESLREDALNDLDLRNLKISRALRANTAPAISQATGVRDIRLLSAGNSTINMDVIDIVEKVLGKEIVKRALFASIASPSERPGTGQQPPLLLLTNHPHGEEASLSSAGLSQQTNKLKATEAGTSAASTSQPSISVASPSMSLKPLPPFTIEAGTSAASTSQPSSPVASPSMSPKRLPQPSLLNLGPESHTGINSSAIRTRSGWPRTQIEKMKQHAKKKKIMKHKALIEHAEKRASLVHPALTNGEENQTNNKK